MIKAAIDIGTNSTRLFIAEVCDSVAADRKRPIIPLERRTDITRLGRNILETGHLDARSVSATLKTLSKYFKLIKKHRAESVSMIATEALRVAKDGPMFIDSVMSKYGIQPEVISGDQEAMLTAFGAVKAPNYLNRKKRDASAITVVTDIGGGSTEVIVIDEGEIPSVHNLRDLKKAVMFKKSHPIGCVTLCEKFSLVGKIDPDNILAARAFVLSHLRGAAKFYKKRLDGEPDPGRLERASLSMISVAGTATSIAAIFQALTKYDSTKVHGSKVKKKWIERTLVDLSNMTTAQRKKMPGLEPKRADVIIAGLIITVSLMDIFKTDFLTVSELDILDGVIINSARLMSDNRVPIIE